MRGCAGRLLIIRDWDLSALECSALSSVDNAGTCYTHTQMLYEVTCRNFTSFHECCSHCIFQPAARIIFNVVQWTQSPSSSVNVSTSTSWFTVCCWLHSQSKTLDSWGGRFARQKHWLVQLQLGRNHVWDNGSYLEKDIIQGHCHKEEEERDQHCHGRITFTHGQVLA